jgi:hypothetical protein
LREGEQSVLAWESPSKSLWVLAWEEAELV